MIRALASTSIRLALGYALLFVLSALALVAMLWWGTARFLDREIDAVILADARAITDRWSDFGPGGALATIQERVATGGDARAVYLLTDAALRPLGGNLAAWPLGVDQAAGWYRAPLVQDGQAHETRLLAARLPGGFHLLVGRDAEDRAGLRGLVLRGLGWVTLVATLLAIAGGVLTRRALLARVETINRTATAIVQGDLGRRVPVTRADSADEFDHLARTINRMLEQIQQLIEGVRNVSNMVAHDLRTPLAELRIRLEEMARPAPDTPERVTNGLGEAMADIDRLMAVFDSLLRLAEIDSGVRRAGFRPFDPAAIAAEVIELYTPLAEAKGLRLDASLGAGIGLEGDPHLIAQALGNLIDNAVKYTPTGGHIRVALARDSGGVLFSVSDDGPGIPEAEREMVIKRFHRGDQARGTPGLGIGLGMVEAIAKLHGGRLTLDDAGPGLVARVWVPGAGWEA